MADTGPVKTHVLRRPATALGRVLTWPATVTRRARRRWSPSVARLRDVTPPWPQLVNGTAWALVLVAEGTAGFTDVSGVLSVVFVLAALGLLYLQRRAWVVYPLTLATYAAALAADANDGLAFLVAGLVFLGVRYGTAWRAMLTPFAALCGALYVGWAGSGGGGDPSTVSEVAGTVWVIVELTVIGAVLAVAINALEQRFSLQRETTELRGRTEASERHTHWLEERTALARDLHDVVGHHVTAMVVQAEAGQVGDAHAALRSVADLGRHALGELDALVVHLRDPDSELPTSAPHRLSDIDDVLAAPLRRQGVDVSVSVADEVALDDAGTLVAYRIAQEALTNVSRHARARSAWVDVDQTGDHVRLRISDDGVGPPHPTEHGCGLLGVHERATARGGFCAVSARPGGGTCVDVFLPAVTRE